MVELLEAGTEAETCYMAGRGMNGLKGIIVCYNPNNQRYTVELGKGDMMSLKIRNVRKIAPNEDNGEGLANANDNDTKQSSTTYSRDEGDSESSLPSFPTPPKVENDAKGQDTFEKQRIMGDIFDMISPVNAILFVLAAYFFLKSNVISSVPFIPSPNMNTPSEVSIPVMITFAVFSYLAWEWGTKPSRRPRGDFKVTNLSLRLSTCDFWEIMGISGLVLWSLEYSVYSIVSVGVMFFFLWKFGTRNGRTDFKWDNVKERAANLNIWEALMVARVLEEGLYFLNSMARPRRR